MLTADIGRNRAPFGVAMQNALFSFNAEALGLQHPTARGVPPFTAADGAFSEVERMARQPRLSSAATLAPLTAWTEFWGLHRGSTYLRQLPDLRGDKEHRYDKAARKEQVRQHPYVAPAPNLRPPLPTYGPEYDDLVRDFLRRFEPAARLRQFETKRQLEDYDASEDRLDLPLALERLQDAGPGLIPS